MLLWKRADIPVTFFSFQIGKYTIKTDYILFKKKRLIILYHMMAENQTCNNIPVNLLFVEYTQHHLAEGLSKCVGGL